MYIAVGSGLLFGAVLSLWLLNPSPASTTLYLVPIGETPPDLLPELAGHFRSAFGLSVTALPQLPPDPAAYNPDRRQYEADRLVEYLRRVQPELAHDARARLIGITGYDLYWDEMRDRWIFTFGVRDADNRVGIVSYARMDPAHLGEAPDEQRLRSRLRKMLTKDVGLMCLGAIAPVLAKDSAEASPFAA